MYEFAAAEGVKVHPNGVSLVMPENSSSNGSAGNGASAAGTASAGRTWNLVRSCMLNRLGTAEAH